MANYIDDAGTYNYDAEFSGTKGTDYNYDEDDEIVWFSSTGDADTGYTLPDSAWILYEVYAPDSYTNALSGGTTVQSKKEWTNTIGTIATTLSTWKTAFDSVTNFTTYKIKATHYKGSDIADVYFADEGEGFSLTGGTEEGITDGEFTGHGSAWILTDDLIADSVVGTTSTYINLYNDTLGTAPSGMTINNFALSTRGTTTARSLVNENNTDDGITFRNTVAFRADIYEDGAQSGDDSFFFPDCILKDYWRQTVGIDRLIELYLPAGTYNIYVTASGFTWGSAASTDFDVNGGTAQAIAPNPTEETVRATFDGIEPDLASFLSVVSTGETIDLNYQATSGSSLILINGIKVEKVA